MRLRRTARARQGHPAYWTRPNKEGSELSGEGSALRAAIPSAPTFIMSFASTGSYRLKALCLVKAHFGARLQVFSGDAPPDSGIRTISRSELDFLPLRNTYPIGRNVLIQDIPYHAYLGCPVLLLDLNPRMPQVWALLIFRRLSNRKTILWGHAWPRAGKGSKSDLLRHGMRTLASFLVTYTVTQADELSMFHPDKRIFAAPNAIYYEREFGFDPSSRRDAIIYVGRMQSEKKVHVLVSAFEIAARTDSSIRLILVGDGQDFEAIKALVLAAEATDRIELLGHIDNYDQLKALYGRAIVSVSPGYVGLSITQSLAFGVPMIISDPEPHSPEIEAAEWGVNASTFPSGDAPALAERIAEFTVSSDDWRKDGNGISSRAASRYSAEAMAQGLISALELAAQ